MSGICGAANVGKLGDGYVGVHCRLCICARSKFFMIKIEYMIY